MKNILVLWSLFFLMVSFAQAQQDNRSKEERIKAVKIAFITEQLQLTAEESQRFWPVYNEMQNELKAIKKEGKSNGRPNLEVMSDQELSDWLDKQLILEENKFAVKRKYIQKFKTVISVRKVVKLIGVEKRFKKELLRRMRERRARRNKR